MTGTEVILLSASWIIYFVIHSWLANESFKQSVIQRFNLDLQKYRLFYVTIVTVLLLPPLWFTFYPDSGLLWKWDGALLWLMNSIAAVGIAGFIVSMKYYDGMAFLGLKPFATKNAEQPFTLSPLHRFVRHPWYFLSLLVIWTRDMTIAWFITCLLITLYFIIGSKLEEQKLILYFGDVYQQYKKKVPGLFPLPWRFLKKEEADFLINQ
ncbi:MAG TPA: hypothetical protein EYH06_13010 [Chromatiales bacterium]|nr:hypothetical protein [Thiotrichales bacterium]HIP69483.1 hypothetical protein [Chromatiales bacterium]